MQYNDCSYRNLYDLVENNAEKNPDKICFFFRDKQYTYKDVQTTIKRTAGVMQAKGVKKGDRIGILLNNSPEFIFSYLAAVSMGAVSIPTNIFLTPMEIATNLNDCETSWLLTGVEFANMEKALLELAPQIKGLFTFGDMPFNSVNIYKTEPETVSYIPQEDELAVILYTSGTTGKPKGAMLTHKNLMANALGFCKVLHVTEADRSLLILPMFHSFTFLTSVLGPLLGNTSIIILETVMDINKEGFYEMLFRLKPTLLMGVPAVYGALARAKVTDTVLKNFPFRACVSGGAPLPHEIYNRFRDTYKVPIVEGYGLSEASPVVSVNPLDKQKPGTIGVALPGVKVRIVDETHKDLPINTAGELAVQGDNVMSGYWNQPEETAKVLKDGWLLTGDVATIDDEGYMTIVDRIKDLILVKGINVYPREIEELLYKYEGVLQAAVVGVHDKDGNEMPVAYIKPAPDAELSVNNIKNYLKDYLAFFKIPRRFIITDNIPMNASGKVLKKELRKIAEEEFGR